MNNHTIYINDDYFQIKTNNIKTIKTNSIDNSEIIDKEGFIRDYKKNIKNNGIIAKKVTILLNKIIVEKDILYYTNIFEELNYSKIELQSTNKYLEDNTIIPNKEMYIIYFENQYYYIYPFLLQCFIQLKNIYKLKVLSNIQLGDNPNCKYYYYSNIENFFIK